MPSGPPASTREKDRACYRHQLCQVDLTVVTTRVRLAHIQCFLADRQNADGSPPSLSYELEIEILDVPALLAEGAKDSDLFDDMLQSVLDTARMLIRNV
jgi:polynucleotide 5'-triphosphatase